MSSNKRRTTVHTADSDENITLGASRAQKSLDMRISEVAVLFANESGSLDENADTDVAELLRKLEGADDVASGVESRLDELLGDLDAMLQGLEEQGQKEEAVKHDDMQEPLEEPPEPGQSALEGSSAGELDEK